MKNFNKNEFKRDCINKSRKILESGEAYEWVYVRPHYYHPEISFENFSACAAWYLNEFDLDYKINNVMSIKNKCIIDNVEALREWFIEEIGIVIADDEWEAMEYHGS